MCGINGFNFRDEELIQKMNTKIAHRGPDDAGVFVGENISLGHRRLSIIDLSQMAHQPMTTPDGRFTVIYNGELYNFKELKKELVEDPELGRRGEFNFKSNSDTEVVLYAYKKWGKECLNFFNGIFSFAIWDNQEKELFLARDQFGVKPLYYYHKDGKFVFSSEAKAILEHKYIERKINQESLNRYLRFLYVAGPETMWQDIKKLPAGHFAILKNNNLEIKKYYFLAEGEYLQDEKEIKGIVRKAMGEAVRRQLVSDKPVGLFLSGGLDSSILCAVMAKEFNCPVKTFSIGFDTDVETEKFNADFKIAEKTAKYFGTDHNPIMLTGKDVLENFENCVIAMDEPVSNHIQVAAYLLAKETKKQVAVALGGDGGDETFGGYDRYYFMNQIYRLRKFFPFLKNKKCSDLLGKALGKKNLSEKLSFKDDLELFLSFMAQKEEIISKFLNNDLNNDLNHYLNNDISYKEKYQPYFEAGWKDKINQMLRADMETWLIDESLVRSDKLTMAHGLEQRVPFLDKDLVELAFRIPSKYKLNTQTQGKKILKDAVSDLLPDFVLEQKKRGFFSPASKWLRGDLKQMSHEILSSGYCDKTKDIFNWEEVRKILDNHIEHKEYALNTIWSLMTFQVWARNYL